MVRRGKGFSLKSRNNRPLSSLNRVFKGLLKNAPKEFLVRRLSDLIGTKIPDAPDGFASALANHLIVAPTEPFVWGTNSHDDDNIELSLTAEDLAPILEATIKFSQEEMPKVYSEALTSAARIILETLEADWPIQRAHDQARMAQFSANLYARWGDAFETLRMMYTISIEIGESIAKSRGRSRPVLSDTIIRLHARACQVVLEIIILMENGLADGAMARWRTLHEITVVATLIADEGEELAVRYRCHEAVEAKRAMDRYVLHHEQLGYSLPTPAEINRIDTAYHDNLARFGDNFGSEYGWAAHHLKIKKPRLVDLEAAVGKAMMQSYYRMASYNIHAGSRGIGFRLGILDGEGTPTALAGPSNAGFVDPAQNTAYDLVQVTALLANGTKRADRMIEWKILTLLRERLLLKLDNAQKELMSSHQAQDKLARRARGRAVD